MDLKHYTQLKPVNENLAITTNFIDHNEIHRSLGLTSERVRELAIEQMRISRDNNNLKPRNAQETLLLMSKIVATPAEFAYLCYKMGQFDHMISPDEKSISSFKNIRQMGPEQINNRITDILAQEGK